MRTSCNGCRVLRKGCSEFCVLRTCLHWINTAESQENATIFLAKFYGRAGLINLISTAPEELRPDIFRSLLYDACGRIVNPIYGSLGLLLSGNWQECQAGVDSVLHGSFPAIKRDNFMSPARKIMVPVGGTVRRELHRSMKGRGRGRMKGPSVAQPTVQKLEKGKFNGEYVETYSTFLPGQERDEFLAAKPEMGSCSDLICSVKSVRDESPACNSLELDLTLRSHSSISLPTSREVSAVDIRRSDAHWDHCMLETYLP